MISNFIFGMITTTCTGTLAFLIWLLLEKVFDRHHMEFAIYHTVKMVVILYLFPLVPILIHIKNRIGCPEGVVQGAVGMITSIVESVCWVLLLVWLIGFIVNIVRYIKKERLWNAIENTSVEADEELQQIVELVKERLGIKRKIQVYIAEEAVSPYIRGIVRIRVFLPIFLKNSGEQEQALMHELTHYKNHDTIVLFLLLLAQMIHWYNPMIWKLQKNVRGWMEIFADNQVYYHYGMGKKYGVFLLHLVQVLQNLTDSFYLRLRSSEDITKERFERIMNFQREIKTKPLVTIIWMAGLSILSCLSVYVTVQAADFTYNFIYDATLETIEEELTEQAEEISTVEFMPLETLSDVDALYGEIDLVDSMMYKFNCTVPMYTKLQSDSFYLEEGQGLEFCISSETKLVTIRIQIVNEEGVGYFTDVEVDDVGEACFKFVCGQSGNYSIYLENISSVDAQVSGGYYLFGY